MKRSLPSWLVLIAIFQIIPLVILPLDTLKSVTPWVWALPVAILAFIGWRLLSGRLWARTATIFIQGFSVIVRLLSLLSGAVTVLSRNEGTTVTHTSLVITTLLSIALSTVVLFSVDRPEVTATLQ